MDLYIISSVEGRGNTVLNPRAMAYADGQAHTVLHYYERGGNLLTGKFVRRLRTLRFLTAQPWTLHLNAGYVKKGTFV